jgi:hypothetical protein
MINQFTHLYHFPTVPSWAFHRLTVNSCIGRSVGQSVRRSVHLPYTTHLHDSLIKVKLSLCFNWAPSHEDVLGEWRYSSTHSLTSALGGGDGSARPSRFIPKERTPGTHWIGGWVGPRAILNAVVKRKIPSPHRESNPRTPIVQPVAQGYTDWGITVPNSVITFINNSSNYRTVWSLCSHIIVNWKKQLSRYSAGLRSGRSGF